MTLDSIDSAAAADDYDYVAALTCGALLLASDVHESERSSRRFKRSDRAEKMANVIETKRKEWRPIDEGAEPDQVTLSVLVGAWSHDDRVRFLVDLSSADPFAPYSVSFKRSEYIDSLRSLALTIGASKALVDEIEDVRRSAVRAYQTSTMRKALAIGLATSVAIGSAGWLAAPAIGTALGSAAGLTGAAATAHGLALLGGGSLASGGFGMAGGMWLVAGTGATVGVVGGSGSTILHQLGAAETRAELVKLQVTFRISVLGTQRDLLKAQLAIMELKKREDELRAVLEEERELNDKNSARVKDLAAKLEDVIAAREWMEGEADGVS